MFRHFNVLACAAAMSLPTAALAEVQARTIKFGHLVQEGHPLAAGVKKFAELVAEKSGGQITVTEFGASVLGSESQQVNALQGGIQEMFLPATTALTGMVPEFGLIDLPFTLTDADQVDHLLQGEFGTELLATLPGTGLIGLDYWETGFRNITSNRGDINSVDDIAGLKIRVQGSPLFVETFSALGTNPVPMAFGELYAALESRAIDAQENPYSIVLTSRFYEVQKNLAETNHVYTANIVLMSEPFWGGLSEEEQGIISEAIAEAGEYQRQLSREQAMADRQELIDAGMQISELTPDVRDGLRSKVEPVVQRFKASYDDRLVELYDANIAGND